MLAPRLAEADAILVRDYLKANMATALANVRATATDTPVSTEKPDTGSYFIYEQPMGYHCPAIIIVADSIDFKTTENKANHINASTTMYVSAIVEDRDATSLSIKCYRYCSAMFSLLNQARLTSTANDVTLTVVVKRARFSDKFQPNERAQQLNVFRKEVSLECEVFHREDFSEG